MSELDLEYIRKRWPENKYLVDPPGSFQTDVDDLISEIDRLRAELAQAKAEAEDLTAELHHAKETILRGHWEEGGVRRENSDLRRALRIKSKHADLCETEIKRLEAELRGPEGEARRLA